MIKYFFIFLYLLSSSVFAQVMKEKPNDFLVFQIIHDQITLDNNNINNASIINHEDGSYKGLLVVLKPPFVNDMKRLTTAGIGKPANLVFNKKIISTTMIQSEIGGSLLITGLTQEEAESFLHALTEREKLKPKENKA